MATDLSVILEDRPGELATLGEALGGAGVNIEGMAAFTGQGRGLIHLLVEDAAGATAALEAAGVQIATQREALVIEIRDQPGSLGELARQLAEASVNIELLYTTFGGVSVVIVSDDLDSARAVL